MITPRSYSSLLACASVCVAAGSALLGVTPLVAKGQQALGSKPWNQGLQCPRRSACHQFLPHVAAMVGANGGTRLWPFTFESLSQPQKLMQLDRASLLNDGSLTPSAHVREARRGSEAKRVLEHGAAHCQGPVSQPSRPPGAVSALLLIPKATCLSLNHALCFLATVWSGMPVWMEGRFSPRGDGSLFSG